MFNKPLPANKIKVKIFNPSFASHLETDINRWLGEQKDNIGVYDICTHHGISAVPGANFAKVEESFSATVVYGEIR